MEEITRKGFLAAAAAAGAAAILPTASASAEEGEAEAPGAALSQVDVEAIEGVESLAESEWAALAAPQVDVVKSHSGVHIMNEPGYFAFSGWDVAHDQPTDWGFAFSNRGLVVKADAVDLAAAGNYGNLADWVVEEGTTGIWRWWKRASGVYEACGWTPVQVEPSGEQHAIIALPFKATACHYANVSRGPNGWIVENPYVHSTRTSEIDVVYWSHNGNSGEAALYLRIVGEWR